MTAAPHGSSGLGRRWLGCLLLLLGGGWLSIAIGSASALVDEPGSQGTGAWPLSPRPTVSAAFDAPAAPWARGHRGVDLLGTVGEPVRAALPGRVTFVGRIAGRGVVVVNHGETRTTYEPVIGTLARGSVVDGGAVIGRLELLASHCHPQACLHWGWRRGDLYLDPLQLIGPAPVRLLPFSGAWMSLLIGRAQPLAGDVGVELGGGQRGMSQHLLDRP